MTLFNPITHLYLGVLFLYRWAIAHLVWSYAASCIQGCDFVGQSLARVLEGPVFMVPGAYPALPETVARKLRETANQHAATLVPKIRRQLGQLVLTGSAVPQLVQGLKAELTWGELIHTSYFENDDVVELLALHVEQAIVLPGQPAVPPTLGDVALWLTSFKSQIKAKVLDQLPSQ